MSGISDREEAFEKKYAHDQELMFKVEARTSKLMGLWAAGKLGITGAAADAYAKEIVTANLEKAGFADVKRRILADFADKGIVLTDHAFERELEKNRAAAKNQIMTDIK